MTQAPSACPVCPRCRIAMRPLHLPRESFGVRGEVCVECDDPDPRHGARPWICPRCQRVELVSNRRR